MELQKIKKEKKKQEKLIDIDSIEIDDVDDDKIKNQDKNEINQNIDMNMNSGYVTDYMSTASVSINSNSNLDTTKKLYPNLDKEKNTNKDIKVYIDLNSSSSSSSNPNPDKDNKSGDDSKTGIVLSSKSLEIWCDPKILSQFQILADCEIFKKQCKDACKKGDLNAFGLLLQNNPHYDISDIINEKIFKISTSGCLKHIVYAMGKRSYFVSAKFINDMLCRKINFKGDEKTNNFNGTYLKDFLNDLIELLESKTFYDEYIYKDIWNFTFDDFIDICKNIIKYETNVKQKLYRTILIMQYLHTNYIAGFNKLGYEFIESILISEFCNNSSSKIIDGLKIRLITQIPKYQNDSKFSDSVTIQKEKL